MRGGDRQSRLLCELCALLLAALHSSPHDAPGTLYPPGPVSPAGFASFLLGASLAMMLGGSLTFLIGFLLMPWVIGLLMLLYVVEIVSGLGRAIVCPDAPLMAQGSVRDE
ncbi:hypothetical protein MUK42_26278 [Musa troglodytarum]|uniref:Uncharacterized protein n=1 Tax=Musa troglodytarum TaxID=320322 RepID=A0A9E7HAI9_9LILI|nr:hypothetical protein MUK42_26278 [Musa troglodytarum]